jgi:hypothetical protein
MDLGETSSALRPRLNSSVTTGLETAETVSREAEDGGQWEFYSNGWNSASRNMDFMSNIMIILGNNQQSVPLFVPII